MAVGSRSSKWGRFAAASLGCLGLRIMTTGSGLTSGGLGSGGASGGGFKATGLSAAMFPLITGSGAVCPT